MGGGGGKIATLYGEFETCLYDSSYYFNTSSKPPDHFNPPAVEASTRKTASSPLLLASRHGHLECMKAGRRAGRDFLSASGNGGKDVRLVNMHLLLS